MAEEGEVKAASGGKGGFVVALLLLAVLGAGAGAGFSMTVLNDDAGSKGKGAPAGKQETHKAAGTGKPGDTPGATKGAGAGGDGDPQKGEQVVGLDPILVTLAGAQKSWARIELSVVIDAAEKDDRATMLKSIGEDLMSFLRTVPLAHIESAVGLEYLREDLSEIARLRSKGRARGVVLRSLVVE